MLAINSFCPPDTMRCCLRQRVELELVAHVANQLFGSLVHPQRSSFSKPHLIGDRSSEEAGKKGCLSRWNTHLTAVADNIFVPKNAGHKSVQSYPEFTYMKRTYDLYNFRGDAEVPKN